MNIYICTSTRNLVAYHMLSEDLVAAGHNVMDWTPLLPRRGPDFERLKDDDPGGHIFLFCSSACASADLIIFIAPSGLDAAFELGIAHNAGVPVWGIAAPTVKRSLMIRGGVRRWFATSEEVCLALNRWQG